MEEEVNLWSVDAYQQDSHFRFVSEMNEIFAANFHHIQLDS